MAYGDLINVTCCDILCTIADNYFNENVVFGYCEQDCFSNGSGGYYEIDTAYFCPSGYVALSCDCFQPSLTGAPFCINYVFDGMGYYFRNIKYYDSGYYFCTLDNYIYVDNNCYLDGSVDFYSNGSGGKYQIITACDADYIFSTGLYFDIVSDGLGGYFKKINISQPLVNRLDIDWDFDQDTKSKYFNSKICSFGNDITLSFSNSKGFYEIDATNETNIYIEEIVKQFKPEYSQICTPFIFIKNNGNKNLILHTDTTTGCIYNFSDHKFHGYSLCNYCLSCTESQFLIDTLGYDYKDFLIAPKESILVCYNGYFVTDPNFCVLVEYPFGYFYQFTNLKQINPSANYPLVSTCELLHDYLYYEKINDFDITNSGQNPQTLKSMGFNQIVDSGLNLEISFRKDICYITGAYYFDTEYRYSGTNFINGCASISIDPIFCNNIGKLSGFVPDLSLIDCGICQISSDYIPYVGLSYFSFFLYESGKDFNNPNYYKYTNDVTFFKNCKYEQKNSWNLNYLYQPFSSNVNINFVNICDGINECTIYDFKCQKYYNIIDSDKKICLLYNLDFDKTKLKRIKYVHCYQYPFKYGSYFQDVYSLCPYPSDKVDLNKSFFDSEINFYGKINSTCLDLNDYFYSNIKTTSGAMLSSRLSNLPNSKFPLFIPCVCTDLNFYDYIPVGLYFDTYVCNDYDVYLDLKLCDNNYALTNISSKIIKRCNMYLQPEFNKVYTLQLNEVNFDNAYIYPNRTRTINCDDQEYQSNKSQAYTVLICNNLNNLNTDSIQSKSYDSCSEEFSLIYSNSKCYYYYNNFQFEYYPINSVFFQGNCYNINQCCIDIMFSGSVFCETVAFPVDALSNLKFKLFTYTNISNLIYNADICLNYSSINFSCNYKNLNNIDFFAPKITCEDLSGFESPNISINLENKIVQNDYINFLINPSNCFIEDRNYGLVDFLYIISSKLNSGIMKDLNGLTILSCPSIFDYESSDYNSLLIDLKQEHLLNKSGYYLCSSWSSFDDRFSSKDLELNYPISYKTLSGTGYNYVLPIICELNLTNDALHVCSGQIHESIVICDKLNYKSTGNQLGGSFTFSPYYDSGICDIIYPPAYTSESNYSFFNQNISFNFAKDDVNNTCNRCININKCYAFTGIQPIKIISNYMIACMKYPISCNDLEEYYPSTSQSGISGVYYYQYNLNNFSSYNLKFLSPDFTYICKINWNIGEQDYALNCNLDCLNLGIIKNNVSQVNFNPTSIISNNNFNYQNNNLNSICFDIRSSL